MSEEIGQNNSEGTDISIRGRTILFQITNTRLLVAVLALLGLLTTHAGVIVPVLSDKHNDGRYVQVSHYEEDIEELRRGLADTNADWKDELKDLKAKLDEMDRKREADTKEMLRYLRK